ncbi:MAG: Smr/MutS family protein [Candidatus Doudnabacteria bacterium]|nr:Smr/MutS family protein [Candidatus Doudnabacteria bacterium]
MNKYEQKPDQVVDLHGLTTVEARYVLDEVFGGAFRHVRVITGKGTLRNGPVMRMFVEGYVRSRGFEFRYAKLSDGGEGALEVFLE